MVLTDISVGAGFLDLSFGASATRIGPGVCPVDTRCRTLTFRESSLSERHAGGGPGNLEVAMIASIAFTIYFMAFGDVYYPLEGDEPF
jgi:hypothetical protein